VVTHEPKIFRETKKNRTHRDDFVNAFLRGSIQVSEKINVYAYIYINQALRSKSRCFTATFLETSKEGFVSNLETWIKVATGAGGRISVNGKFVSDIWPYHGA